MGFTTLVDSVLNALQRQNLLPEIPSDRLMIVYCESRTCEAISLSVEKRKEGGKVMCIPVMDGVEASEYVRLAGKTNGGGVMYLKEDGCVEILV